MTSVGAILDQIRELYVSQFVAAILEAESDADARVYTEGELVDANGNVVTEGVLDLGVRTDIVVLSTGGTSSISVDSARTLAFSPVDFQWEGRMSVRLEPFGWDYCELNIFPGLELSSAQPLAAWFREWFEPHDHEEGRILGVPHFISDPEPNGDQQRYYVDFGTAPVKAFEALLDACLRGGVTRVIASAATA